MLSSRSKAVPGSSPNSHLVGVAVAATVPMAVTQIILAWISLAFEVPPSRLRQHGAASQSTCPSSKSSSV